MSRTFYSPTDVKARLIHLRPKHKTCIGLKVGGFSGSICFQLKMISIQLSGPLFDPLLVLPCNLPKHTKDFKSFLTGLWTLGPDLPTTLTGATMVQHPQGGVLVLGGNTASGWNTKIFYLASASAAAASWNELTQTLTAARQ